MHRDHAGFTLMELLVAIAVAALLLSVALPAWTAAIARGHAADARTRLLSTLVKSVERSSTLGAEVVVCPSLDGSGCNPSTDWSRGWIAFADLDGDRARRDAEPVLQRVDGINGRIGLRSTTGRTRLVFQPSGGNAGSNVTFTLCHRRDPSSAVTLVLANDGRLRQGAATAAAAEICALG